MVFILQTLEKMALDMPTFIPATPFGIMELLDRYNVPTAGKHTVVIADLILLVDQ